jgi:hypothetical protein
VNIAGRTPVLRLPTTNPRWERGVKAVRRALDDDGESQRYVRTVRGRGYQFVRTFLTDNESEPAAEATPEPAPPRQHIAFCRAADDVRLAYAVAGEGPPLIRAANWMTHLGYDIESPVWKTLGARPVHEVSIHPLRRTWL